MRAVAVTLQVSRTRRQRNLPAPATREVLQELPRSTASCPTIGSVGPSMGADLARSLRDSPRQPHPRFHRRGRSSIRRPHGTRYSRAVECAQTLVFEEVLGALTPSETP